MPESNVPWQQYSALPDSHALDLPHTVQPAEENKVRAKGFNSIASESHSTIEIGISMMTVAKGLAIIAALLLLLSLAGQFSRFYLHHWSSLGLVQLTDVDSEYNLPSWYKSSMFLVGSILIAMISIIEKKKRARYVSHWYGLLAVFLILSFDGIAQYHQVVGEMVKNTFKPGGFLSYLRIAWVIPGAIFVTLFMATYLRFMLHLPRKTCVLFLVGGGAYVIGALVFHSLSASYAVANNIYFSMKLSLINTVGEGLKIVGLSIFVYALLSHMASYLGGLRIHIDRDDPWSS